MKETKAFLYIVQYQHFLNFQLIHLIFVKLRWSDLFVVRRNDTLYNKLRRSKTFVVKQFITIQQAP